MYNRQGRSLTLIARTTCAALFVMFAAACAPIHIAPDYSPETATAIVDTEKAVDTFYASVSAVPEGQRTFQQFSAGYQNVEVEIRALILRCKIQPMNGKSVDMANTLLDLWSKKEARHKQSNSYSDALLNIDQQTIDGLLTSMALVQQSLKDSVNK